MSGAKIFDRLLEKVTSSFLLEPDWESILKICDLIRQGDVQAKYAVSQLKKKLASDNIHVLNYSLQCVESMVKNCGSKVHQEIATKDFMDVLRNLILTKSDPVKNKALELIQCWSHAFKKNPNFKIVEDYYNAIKLEGFQYPVFREADAMFDVEEAPQWIDDSESSNCYRCRAEFSTIKRRHHCRACGQIFCHACSSKTATIPKYGIEKEVRVCDTCFDKLKANPQANITGPLKQNSNDLPSEYLNSQLYRESKMVSEADLKKKNEKTEQEFEEELQLAMALSESEAEAKNKANKKFQKAHQTNTESSSSSRSSSFASAPFYETNTSNNLTTNEKTSSIMSSTKKVVVLDIKEDKNFEQEQDENSEEYKIDLEINQFVDELKKLLELYLNRMKSDSLRGRSITNDTAVQSLYLQLQNLVPQLLSYIKYKEDVRGYYENLQDKLTQLKDAREALNALRHENFEKKRRELEEKEKLRQMQIAQKLQAMRQQKHNYYLYQNQLNLQRLKEQEQDLQMRLNQQRQLVFQRELTLTNPQAPTGIENLPGTVLPEVSANPNIPIQIYHNQFSQMPITNPVYPAQNMIPGVQIQNQVPQMQMQAQQIPQMGPYIDPSNQIQYQMNNYPPAGQPNLQNMNNGPNQLVNNQMMNQIPNDGLRPNEASREEQLISFD